MRRASAALLGGFVACGACEALSCAPSGFADPQVISNVRILASSADTPYAKPGATVNLQTLAYDGRPTKPQAMTLSWIPIVCENPASDAYYACFQSFAGGDGGAPGDAGTGGVGSRLPVGVDLTPFLPAGPTFQFTMPSDAVTAHPTVAGAPVPYGLAVIFNVACAGHLELVPVTDGNPQSVPLGCFDAQHNQLGADDFVFGFTRVYAYDTLANANPVIASVDIGGKTFAVSPTAGASQIYTADGVTVPACASSKSSDCTVHIGPVVPASSQEDNPEAQTADGQPIKEEIWADFFTTFGSFGDEARLLYDSAHGLVGPPSTTDDAFTVPSDPGDGTIWIVVHDNRDGASWVTIPVHVQ